MPTYEYRCKSCDHQFEAVQAFTDDALTECPECSGPLKKVFGNVGITFKGSGFYKTDSRSGSGSGSSGSSSSSDSGSSDSGSSNGSGSSSEGASAEPKKADKKADAPTAPSSAGSKTAG